MVYGRKNTLIETFVYNKFKPATLDEFSSPKIPRQSGHERVPDWTSMTTAIYMAHLTVQCEEVYKIK